MKICTQCGAQNADTDNFCRGCGAGLTLSQAQESMPQFVSESQQSKQNAEFSDQARQFASQTQQFVQQQVGQNLNKAQINNFFVWLRDVLKNPSVERPIRAFLL